jgi:hypothetical protein
MRRVLRVGITCGSERRDQLGTPRGTESDQTLANAFVYVHVYVCHDTYTG